MALTVRDILDAEPVARAPAATSSRRSPAISSEPAAGAGPGQRRRDRAQRRPPAPRAAAAGTALCAVVKADGYGHGAAPAARAALAGGATWLAVATANEATQLRAHGVDGPLLVLGALSPEELDAALSAARRRRRVARGVRRRGGRARRRARARQARHRDGAPGHARPAGGHARGAGGRRERAGVELVGAMTHFATADELGDDFFGEQLERFAAWAPAAARAPPGPDPARRELRRAAARRRQPLRPRPRRRRDLRPGPVPGGCRRARPRARAGARQLRRRGQALRARRERGLRPALRGAEETVLATVPIGYGDGVSRALTNNADLLVGGRRFPLVGTVSMDNVALDLGADGGGVAARRRGAAHRRRACPPRRWRGAWAPSTTRSRAR